MKYNGGPRGLIAEMPHTRTSFLFPPDGVRTNGQWERYLNEERPHLIRYAQTGLHLPPDFAEDAVQKASAVLWKSPHLIRRPPNALFRYVFVNILKKMTLQLLRADSCYQDHLDAYQEELTRDACRPSRSDNRTAIRNFLAKDYADGVLDELVAEGEIQRPHAEIWKASYLAEKKQQEIARERGVSQATVCLALKTVDTYLKEHCDEILGDVGLK